MGCLQESYGVFSLRVQRGVFMKLNVKEIIEYLKFNIYLFELYFVECTSEVLFLCNPRVPHLICNLDISCDPKGGTFAK